MIMTYKRFLLIAALVIAVGLLVATRVDARPIPHTTVTLAAAAVQCSWSTDGAWHWSAYYNVWYEYTGHVVKNGHYYRRFIISRCNGGCNPPSWSYADVYCG